MKMENKFEIFFKGIANRNRIKILSFINKNPESKISDISNIAKIDLRTISDHIIKMEKAGLVIKRKNKDASVRLKITPKGILLINLMKKISEQTKIN